jgi:zinc finger protein
MSDPVDNPKPDGKAFDDFFDSIGSKAQQVDASKEKDATTATGTDAAPVEEEEEQKVVDEIESLCMNCHANVGILLSLNVMDMF